MNMIPTPTIDYFQVAPMLIVLAAAIIGVLVEAMAPRRARYLSQLALTSIGLLSALVMSVIVLNRLDPGSLSPKRGQVVAMGALAIDGPTLFTWALVLVLGLLAMMLFAERHLEGGVLAFAGQAAALPGTEAERQASSRGMEHTEVFPLMLFAVAGMMMFPASTDMLALFVALEVFSLPLYLLCGLARRRRLLSQEAALKYFLLGAFSSAFFVYGIALVYGFAGTMSYAGIAQAVAGSDNSQVLLFGGLGLMTAGLLFKVGAVPFHAWTPDAYQGAPTPVTGFMAAATKLAAFGAILRLTYVGLEASRWDWRVGVGIIAALTMIVGAVVSIKQTDMKRLLAYSSIAHAGFVLVGVLAFDKTAIAGVLFYLVAYGLATIAAFAIVAMVRQSGSEATNVSQWAGLGKKHPVVAGCFGLLLLAFAGIPLTSGFTAKFAVFAPAIAHGDLMGIILVVIGVLASGVTAYIYFRIIVLMYFEDAPGGDEVVALNPGIATTVVVTVGVLATLLLGIVPGLLLEIANSSSLFLL